MQLSAHSSSSLIDIRSNLKLVGDFSYQTLKVLPANQNDNLQMIPADITSVGKETFRASSAGKSVNCHSRKYAGTGARRAPFEERYSPPSSKVSPYGRNDKLLRKPVVVETTPQSMQVLWTHFPPTS